MSRTAFYLRLIFQDPEGSELVSYLRKLLSQGIGKENNANHAANNQPNAQVRQDQNQSLTESNAEFSLSEETFHPSFLEIRSRGPGRDLQEDRAEGSDEAGAAGALHLQAAEPTGENEKIATWLTFKNRL